MRLVEADARAIPFGQRTFDMIVSSWALHNIIDAAGRECALREMVRVLRPGGRLVIVDIQRTAEYERVLRTLGLDVRRSGPSFQFLIPTHVLTAVLTPRERV